MTALETFKVKLIEPAVLVLPFLQCESARYCDAWEKQIGSV